MKTIENCQLIKRMIKEMVGYPLIKDGKCEGYVISEENDEPCDTCKECKYLDCEQ